MWIYEKRLIYPVKVTKPNPRMARIIANLFAGDAGENFCSLTDEQAAHFMQRFIEPEDISQEDVQADTGFIFYSF